MYRVDRNNFFKNEKKATIYTPNWVSQFLYDILSLQITQGLIFDPCVGQGSLLLPWQKQKEFDVLGVDVEQTNFSPFLHKNFLALTQQDLKNQKPSLVITNPPFNLDAKTKDYVKKKYGGRPLLPELWLKKIIELFGRNIPLVLFTPYGFRLNQSLKSKRLQKFLNQEYPTISSIISLPKDVFANVLFHAEILIFNVSNLKPHYFIGEK
ncbi:N-6 DNA methylase [Mulberry dwarf phytoplasma]|uniref:N-6 DNA methylase n=1 Tax=Mulberry dwarf phytoplasma TaxID=186171 RepID=UPI001D10FAE0|nr:N-6 DNA methylase [Mulberry dwarf phytoplasma]